MVVDIDDLWILTKAGITIFRKLQNDSVQDQLFGALMSALNSFSSKVFEGELSTFGFGNKIFTIIRKNDIIFVGSHLKKVKEKKIIKELEFVIKKFFEVYPKDLLDNLLSKWDGDIDVFSDFGKHIYETTEEKFKELF